MAPVEVEWPQRLELGRAIGKTEFDYDDMLRASGGGRFAAYHHRFMFGSVASHLAEAFGTKGSPISLSTACASGATAIQLGVEAIRRGEADAALCVATDGSVNPEALVRFSLLSALSTQNDPPQAASKPFSKNRDGFVMAEGAGALVLESYEAAIARGATILGVVAGCGELTDSFHRTRSSPDGKPIIGCMRKALADAGLDAGTDRPHQRARHRDAGKRQDGISTPPPSCSASTLPKIPVSSNKSMVGHTISAAGAVEADLLAADAGASADSADHQLRDSGSGDPVRRGPQQGARRPRHRRDVELVRLRRAERLADPDARTGLAASCPVYA